MSIIQVTSHGRIDARRKRLMRRCELDRRVELNKQQKWLHLNETVLRGKKSKKQETVRTSCIFMLMID